MEKTIIALSGVENSGKTSSLRLLRNKLSKKHGAIEDSHEEIGNPEEDFITYLNIKGIKIAIISQGDNLDDLEGPLETAIAEKCNLIICACRSKGATVDLIKSINKKYDKIRITKNAICDAKKADREMLEGFANKSCRDLLMKIITTQYSI